MDADVVIGAIGQRVDNGLLKSLGVATHLEGTARMNENGETSRPGVFVAGDVTSGGATVIQAIAEGGTVATRMDQYLKKV